MSGPIFLAGLALGALAGAVCGLLSSPRSGRENRQALREKVPELPDALTRITEEVKSRLHEGRQAYRAAAAETRQRMTQELEADQRGEGGAS